MKNNSNSKKTTRNIIFAVEILVIVVMLAAFIIITQTTETTEGPKRPENWDTENLGISEVTMELEDQVVTILNEWLGNGDVAASLDQENVATVKSWLEKKSASKDYSDPELDSNVFEIISKWLKPEGNESTVVTLEKDKLTILDEWLVKQEVQNQKSENGNYMNIALFGVDAKTDKQLFKGSRTDI